MLGSGRGSPTHAASTGAATLPEVCIAMLIGAVTLGGIMNGYVLTAQRAEWSAYNLAAQSLASQRLEQTRAAKWDPLGWPPVDQIVMTNFPPVVDILDIPVTGTNITYATNTITITAVSTSPPLKMVRVDCTWRFLNRGVFTNTLVTYRAPDQ